MSGKENDGLAKLVLEAIIFSRENIVTCQDIKDSLATQGTDSYSREKILQAIESISKQRSGEFKFIIVTRIGKLEFAISKIEKFHEQYFTINGV